ncbi:hypothetical protein LQZ18_06250 [Lachnospiraceae bacterium ZAX-1]
MKIKQIYNKKNIERINNTEIKWHKLDNTAHIFPVIAAESMSNVYRISVTLKEKIQPGPLQEALDIILPFFDVFHVRLRKGIFWYYFETNKNAAPRVLEEMAYPNQYIAPNKNRSYLFRISYYHCRINLEVFHVLTDGMGGINFLRELTYQYLRIVHPELKELVADALCSDTSLNKEDSFLKNYKKSHAKGYKTERAILIKGEKLKPLELGILHGYMPITQLKAASKKRGASINEYLAAVLFWSIYTEYLHRQPTKSPLSIAIPVNLRPYYNSITTKNFFVVVSAIFKVEKEDYTFEDIVNITMDSLRKQINPKHLENLFAYNVSNEKNLILRAVPIIIKNIVIRHVYHTTALANTTTMTNIGNIPIREEYQQYVDKFHAFLSMSKGQNIKGCICSYQNTLVFTFSSTLVDVSVEKAFFRKLAEEGIDIEIESNGVYD